MKLGLALGASTLLLVGVACSSAPNDTTLTPGLVATGPTSRPPSRPPSQPPPPSDPPEDPYSECPYDMSLTEKDLDAEIGWKPGTPAQGSCTEADLTQISANFKDTNIQTYFDLAKGVTDTCKACVVSKDTDASWGPIVGIAADKGQTGFINYGACFGAIEGAACGKAIQYESFCTGIACNECAYSTPERAKCVSASTEGNGMCASFAGARTTSCPSWTLNVKSCGDIQVAIKTLCGTP